MRGSMAKFIAFVAALLAARAAGAAPALRFKVDQRGDFAITGNTLGHNCAPGVPAPVVGTVGNCGMNVNDTAPDVYWRADAPNAGAATGDNTITPAAARATAMLNLPAGSTVTYARLYWSSLRSGAAPDTSVTVERVGAGAFQATATADASATGTSGNDNYYQSTADVTALVQAHGPGAYRVGAVDSVDIRNLNDPQTYAAWTLVVFYRLDTEPPRNLTLFDGLDLIDQRNNTSVTVNLSGFLVPNAGFDAKLAVVAYEGDATITGDSLSFNGTTLTNGLNPANNFFNSTRSNLGNAVSNAGDLPQLTGTARSMSGYDQDVIDVTSLLKKGDTSATITATTTGDFYALGAFVTSISTFKPDFTTTDKTFTNITRGDGTVRPGDVLEYTVTTTNSGNDTGVGVVMTDALPAGVTFVSGSLRVTAGANAGAKTDAAGDDQGEYNAGTRTVTVRLGAGANAAQGGTMAVGATTTVVFRVTVNADATGTIANQAVVSASGQAGAPSATYPSDGNGPMAGAPPTMTGIDQCAANGDCPAPRPFCLTTAHPYTCVSCRTNADCPATLPNCDAMTHACRGCLTDADCSGATPFCLTSTQACVGCRTSADCSGTAPVCTAANTCGPCTADGAPSCPDPKLPACQKSGPLTGACTECSATNATLCTGARPQCLTDLGFCGCSDRDGDSECGGPMSGIICNGPAGACVPGCSEAPMRNRCPAGQTCSVMGGGVGVCMVAACNADTDCKDPRPRCDLAQNPHQCVQCLADADCKGGFVCDTGMHLCVECTAMKTANCSAGAAGSRCLGTETCGCTADSDCGDVRSGRVCDGVLQKCTFGCRGMGGNGCPTGVTCSSTTNLVGRCGNTPVPDAGADTRTAPDAAPDARGADATVVADARPVDAPADAPASDATVARDAPAPSDAAVPTPSDGRSDAGAGGAPGSDAGARVGAYLAGGGCKCDLGRRGPGGGMAGALLVVAAMALRRRRRR